MWAFVATTLVLSSGCTKQDWIDRTLVTVDVTGTWLGDIEGTAGGSRELSLELEQQGSTVKGFIRMTGGGANPLWVRPGPIDGTVAGDVFRFRQPNGHAEGEMTVSGDEMNGKMSLGTIRAVILRRVDPSRPGSLPR